MGLNRLSDEVIVYTSITHENHRRSSYVSRILVWKKGMGSGDNSRQNEARIFEIRQKLSEQEQKISFCSSNFRQILTIRMSI